MSTSQTPRTIQTPATPTGDVPLDVVEPPAGVTVEPVAGLVVGPVDQGVVASRLVIAGVGFVDAGEAGARPAAGSVRSGGRISAFQAGVLAVGVGIGGPVVTVAGLLAGDLRAVLFPAVVVAVVWWAGRWEGRAGLRAMLRRPLVRRAELSRFLAGAVVTLVGLAWLVGGGR